MLAGTGRRAGASKTGLVSMSRKRKSEVAKRPSTAHLRPLSEKTLDFFAARDISPSTLQRNGVRETPQGDIAFLYFRDGEVINIKYRSLDKRFWQVRRTPLTACPHGRWRAAMCGQGSYADSNIALSAKQVVQSCSLAEQHSGNILCFADVQGAFV